jgi:uncharacterized membrane protein
VKRRDVEDTFLASHYDWLIRTFWWALLWGALLIGGMVWVIVPNAVQLGELARTGDYFSIPWEIIAAGVVGGVGISIVWFWTVYRFIRGILRLADGRAVP